MANINDYPQPNDPDFSVYKLMVLLRYQHEQIQILRAAVQDLAPHRGFEQEVADRMAHEEENMRTLLTATKESGL